MIQEINFNQIYYEGSTVPPFYTERTATNCNDDGTYSTKEHPRQGVTSTALSHWHETKEEAIKNMMDYYFERFFKTDNSQLADIYQQFDKDMSEYIKENYPELFL